MNNKIKDLEDYVILISGLIGNKNSVFYNDEFLKKSIKKVKLSIDDIKKQSYNNNKEDKNEKMLSL